MHLTKAVRIRVVRFEVLMREPQLSPSPEPDHQAAGVIFTSPQVRVSRLSDQDAVVVDTKPNTQQAVVCGLVVFLLGYPLFHAIFWFPQELLPYRIQTSGDVIAFLMFAGLLTICILMFLLGVMGLFLSVFPRRFRFRNDTLHFTGIPGLNLRIPFPDIEAVYLVTAHSNKHGWSCNVAIGLAGKSKRKLLVVNWAPLCTRHERMHHRGTESEEQWLLEVHRPLATLLGGLIAKPVEEMRSLSALQLSFQMYWR